MVQDSLQFIEEMGYAGQAEMLKGLFEKRRYDEVVTQSHELSCNILHQRGLVAEDEAMRR